MANWLIDWLINLIFASFYHRYGDRSPKSALGRVFCILWIITGVIIVSIFTALVTASLSASTVKIFKIHGSKVVLNNFFSLNNVLPSLPFPSFNLFLLLFPLFFVVIVIFFKHYRVLTRSEKHPRYLNYNFCVNNFTRDSVLTVANDARPLVDMTC